MASPPIGISRERKAIVRLMSGRSWRLGLPSPVYPGSDPVLPCRARRGRIRRNEDMSIENSAEDPGPIAAYHEATKHHLQRFAAGPHGLDWATQPHPFRSFAGARRIPLMRMEPAADEPLYARALVPGGVPPRPLDRAGLSQLLFDSLAISAWKGFGSDRWALRVNPSSGNLHPTEGHVIAGPVEGVCEGPIVAHYGPRQHELEVRAEPSPELWRELSRELPAGAFLMGMSSIHWREAWKYGERAFRYCQHDAGHAIAALSVAAAGLGWRVRLLDDLAGEEVGALLGITDQAGPEAEHPDLLLVIAPQGEGALPAGLPEEACRAFVSLAFAGEVNRLSPRHVDWNLIDRAAEASRKPRTRDAYADEPPAGAPLPAFEGEASLRRVVRTRRSAQAFDGRSRMALSDLHRVLLRTLPAPGAAPFDALPWSPRVDLFLFVHRVEGLDEGLYCLLRDPSREPALRAACSESFLWKRPRRCPSELSFHLLQPGDARDLARQLSCNQDIASDGCFSLGMVADFEASLARHGPWFYRRLFWECGAIGQALYLEAEALGWRGTGIGCYFDDEVHEVLGLRGPAFQSLYHFTMGRPVDDPRMMSLPAYDRDPGEGEVGIH